VEYYQQMVPPCLRREARTLSHRERGDVQQFTRATRLQSSFAAALPPCSTACPGGAIGRDSGSRLEELLAENGFDAPSMNRYGRTCAAAASACR
jgi:hypothetical protein